MHRRAPILIAALVLAGCGGDDGDAEPIAARDDTTTTSDARPEDGAVTTTSTTAATMTTTSTTSASRAPGTASTSRSPTPTTTTAPPAPTTTSPPATTTTAPPARSSIAVTASGFAFVPDQLEAAAGAVHVTATNEDSATHTFTVEGTSIDIPLPPNGSGTADATLVAGRYDFVCRVHPSMTGVLTVS